MTTTEGSKISRLLDLAINSKASDLHIAVGSPAMLRIDGKLSEVRDEGVLKAAEVPALLQAIMQDQDLAKFNLEREVDFGYQHRESRLRVNAFHERGNVAVAIRLIPSQIPSLSELHLTPVFEKMTHARQGLFLVTGPTGHGKTTTVASMIEHINQSRRVHIVTIEDPIEFRFTNKKSLIQQREVGTDTLSFKQALRSVVREDPNVVVLGEMRDLDTVEAALQLADTGHLVLATVHTTDCAHAIGRIIDIFPSGHQEHIRNQFSSVLLGISAQRLLHSRIKGRVPALEVLIANNAVRNLIREKKEHQIVNVLQTGTEDGMITLDNSLRDLVAAGMVEREEALLWAADPKTLG